MDKLSPDQLPQLFNEPIYVLDRPTTGRQDNADATAAEHPEIKGQNNKGILIVNEDTAHTPISPEDEAFIFKGLNRLGITLDDVAIISSGDEQKASIDHRKKIILQQNPSPQNLYQVISEKDGQILNCHTIAAIRQNQELKVKFWLALKEMFAANG